MASADSVQQALEKFADTFQRHEKAGDLAKLTRHVLSLLGDADTRARGVETLIQLQDQLHIARRLGNFVEEANAVEAIAGRMRTDDAYCLDSPLPMVQAEQSDEMKALIKQMQEADLQSRPYEFLNTADSEEMTVNISVPAETQMKDVSVKLSATKIRVEIKGHEMQPCIIDGSFFQAVDPAGCDHHLEGSGAKRMLVIDLEKKQNGLKWPDLLGYGAM
ncbi:BOB2 [Symbiodinium pilosum]|uniref:NudC domain-containing protein 1 n=1 Tax=Symbiodinium pilosum TaxID=2952 RepID=A0A812UWA5_SYMPI|nr:BOB2 [Symbiodinium pilosum]